MDDVTAIEIKEDGIAGDNSSREEHSKKMAEDCGVAGSNEDSTDCKYNYDWKCVCYRNLI